MIMKKAEKMDGWVDRWTDGWLEEWMDRSSK